MTDKDLDKVFLNDADFIALVEKEMAARPAAKDHLLEQRVWNRLQNSVAQDQATKKKRFSGPAWAAAAAGILLLGVATRWLLPPEDEVPSFKSGEIAPPSSFDFLFEKTETSLSLRVAPNAVRPGAFALIALPLRILWKGSAADWREPLALNSGSSERICVLEAASMDELERKIQIVLAMNELPHDARCQNVPQ